VTRDEFLAALRSAAEPEPARILDALLACAGAERGFLLLREGDGLDVRTARAMDGDEIARAREKVSSTLLERALREGRPVVGTDADLDRIDSLAGQKVRSVCVLPLRACGGAVYLDHRFQRGLFAEPDFLGAVASALDVALRGVLDRSGELVGGSNAMRELRRLIDRVAAAPYPALVIGESGTGKELVARAVHRRSPRSAGPFVAANAAALPDALVESELFGHIRGAFTGAERDRAGLFEQARGGTLFLDEVACLPEKAQESLLRVLETSEFRRVGGSRTEKADVRIVAATNEDLEKAGLFRPDLYYRLNVLRLDLPPLRERLEDLPELCEHLLGRIARETRKARRSLAKSALARLAEHPWPGNVRELENALRRAVSLSDQDPLPGEDFAFLKAPPAPKSFGPEDAFPSLDEHAREIYLRFRGRVDDQAIADRLGLSRKTLWEKKKRWGL
jgi:DNA-binding NtrC family response regulator